MTTQTTHDNQHQADPARVWTRTRSRAHFLRAAAGATGAVLSAGLWLPTQALADNTAAAAHKPLRATKTNAAPAVVLLRAHQVDEVGFGKTMTSDVTLYANGSMVCKTKSENRNWFTGLRGQVLVVAVDGSGQAIWVSDILQCPTMCSVPDLSCASVGTYTFQQNWPAPVGQYAAQLDVYQADEPNYVDLQEKLATFKQAICSVIDSVPALRPYIVCP